MSDAQVRKVREIIRKVETAPHKPEIGGWVEKEHVYLFVKTDKLERGAGSARLYAIDRDGAVAVHRNFAPLKLQNNTLIMGCMSC